MPDSLRILAINWRDIRHPEAGGAEVHLHEIFKRLARAGHEVVILVSSFHGGPAEEEYDGLYVVRRGSRATFNYSVPSSYRDLDRRFRFDLVVDDINKIPFCTPLYVKKPLLGLIHHFFGTSIFLEVPFPAAAYVYLSELLVPLVYRRTTFAVVSESSRDELIQKGVPGGQVHVIHNGVDHDVYTPPSSGECSPQNAHRVVYIGRIKKYKNIECALRSIAILKDQIPVHLDVVGDGDHLPALGREAHRLGIENVVTFHGQVSQEEKVRLLQQARVVLNPSSKEGWGLTVIEANACGSPVVASRVPGLRDAVRDGETGYLVPFNDPNSMAERCVTILTDPELRSQLSLKAIEWAARFTWDASAAKMLDLLEQVVRGDR